LLVYYADMASIKQYRGKTWRAIIRRKGFPVQSKTFASKKDAEAWAASVESRLGVSQFDGLQLKAAKTMTVRDVFERYEREVAPNFKGRNSLGILKRVIRDAAFMDLVLSKITPLDIRQWRDDRAQDIQPQSVHRELNTISGVFTHAIKEWGVPLASNPCHSVSRFKGADKSRDKVWSPADVTTLLDAIGWREDMPLGEGRDYVGWALLLGIETAMRIGELCALRVSDFHPAEQYAQLRDTKNGDDRQVPLSTTAIKYLMILCANKMPTDKVFPLIAATLGEYFLEARRKCGLEHLVFHDSRHTAATQLSAKLPNVLELSAVTGHRSLKSLKRYFHPTPAAIAGKLG
jgi:integrase